jgi:hypothetical protein
MASDGRNPLTAAQILIEGIQKALDKKLLVTGMFLDLNTAVDVLSYKVVAAS